MAADRTTLAALNAASDADFARALDGIFEHAPWVAARAAAARPFATVGALHAALMAAVRAATAAEQRRFLGGHPELSAGALPADLTDASRDEQGGAGLGGAAGAEELARLNAAYRARHGIPFLICLRRHTAADVMRQLRRRLERTPEAEHDAALEEVAQVSRLRLAARLDAPDAEPPCGAVTARAADAAGRALPGVTLGLEVEGAPLAARVTDAEGVATLLSGEAVRIGRYALRIEGAALPFAIEDPARGIVLRVLKGATGWGPEE